MTETPHGLPNSIATGASAPSFADSGLGAPAAPAAPRFSMTIDDILTAAVEKKASDIHLSAHTPVMMRIDGDLEQVPEFPTVLTPAWLAENLKGCMKGDQWERFEMGREMDMSYTVPAAGRFRLNVMWQRESVAAVFRIIPTKILTLEELKVPPILAELAKKPKGLILVTGPTGSGKSTTLAGMIDQINATKPDHIMTIEDPIEFVHQNKRALINQREVGSDTKSFAEALKRVLRQDPDIILVGELRDPETISVALTAAETGHLVFGTLHTQSAAKTINRLIDSFPAHQQNQVRSQLSDTLQAVIAQSLLKKIGGGRVAATEIMVRTNAIANLIREGQIGQMYSAIQTGSTYGMHTLDQDLQRLVGQGLVAREEAAPYLIDPSALDGLSTRHANDWEH